MHLTDKTLRADPKVDAWLRAIPDGQVTRAVAKVLKAHVHRRPVEERLAAMEASLGRIERLLEQGGVVQVVPEGQAAKEGLDEETRRNLLSLGV